MIFRRRRPILIGSAVLVLIAAVFALPVFGELGNENDFDDPSAEAVRARSEIVDATGAFAAPQLVVLGSICVFLNTLVDVVAVLLAVRLLRSEGARRARARMLTRASGAMMVTLGAYLALARRQT